MIDKLGSPDKDYYLSNSLWKATLNNGEEYWDTNKVVSAWQTLREYCKQEKKWVKSIEVSFRKNKITFPEDCRAYFFRKKVLGSLSFNQHFFLVGYIREDEVIVDHWLVPELQFEETDVRKVEDCLDSLIWKQ